MSEKFKEIVRNGNKLEIKVSLKNRLLFARDIDSFDEMLCYVRKNNINIYEKHDNKNFPSEDSGEWNENLLDKEINNLVDNFSEERVKNIRKLIQKLVPKTTTSTTLSSKRSFSQNNSRRKRFEANRNVSNSKFTKNISAGLTVVGGVVIATSLFTGLGVKTLVGAAIVGAGIIIWVSENK